MSKMSNDFDEDARSNNTNDEDVAVDKYHRHDRRSDPVIPINQRSVIIECSCDLRGEVVQV